MDDLDVLLTEKQYAEIRQESDPTIQRERENGNGCRFVKIGRAVRYRKRDIVEFIERHLRHSTSESIGSPATPSVGDSRALTSDRTTRLAVGSGSRVQTAEETTSFDTS
jgi:predicted DNA-binding transcriptional regulator AlpA